MGCRLNKLQKPEVKRPGNIYSTLKRPQVETRTDVSYEYRFLEFTTLDNGIPNCSAIRISSLRDLPAQLQELYQHGFLLAAVHPFVQPTAGRERTPLEQIFRAVLIKKTQRSDKPDPPTEACSLVVECCLSTDRLSDQTIQPDFVKTIEDAASRGLKFVGIIHQYSSLASCGGSPPETPARSGPAEPPVHNGPAEAARDVKHTSKHHTALDPEGQGPTDGPVPSERSADQCAEPSEEGTGEAQGRGHIALEDSVSGGSGEPPQEENLRLSRERPKEEMPALLTDRPGEKAEIFAIFNKPQTQRRYDYYTVKIPIRICKNGQSASSLEANWLEHMTEHFKRGGSLVNTAFYPGMVNDLSPGSTDGVFVFEDPPEADDKATRGYDAIVVEQLTILEGARVQTDYVPLLNSLADYGWQLTCVLPTPIVKTDSEGNVATKQIVFLQRPSLPHRGKKKFPWRFSKEEKQGRKSRKAAKEKASSRKQQLAEGKMESNCVENERNARELSKCYVILDANLQLRNGAEGVMPKEAEDLQEHGASPVHQEDKEGAEDLQECGVSPVQQEDKEGAEDLQERGVSPVQQEDKEGVEDLQEYGVSPVQQEDKEGTENLQECLVSPVQQEDKEGAQTMECPASTGSTQGEGTVKCTASEEQVSQWAEDTAGADQEESS